VEANVIRWSCLIGLSLVVLACGKDPARAVRIEPPATVTPAVVAPVVEWRPEFCVPIDEAPGGKSTLVATGPCPFQHHGDVSCHANTDDFYLVGSRKTKLGATLMIYINIEHYSGPGSYDGAQMYVAIQGEQAVYRWANDSIRISVSKGEADATMPVARLGAEAPAVDTLSIGGKMVCKGGGATAGTDASGFPARP